MDAVPNPNTESQIFTMDPDSLNYMLRLLLSGIGPKTTSPKLFESFAIFVQGQLAELKQDAKSIQAEIAAMNQAIERQNALIARILDEMGIVGLDEAKFSLGDRSNLEVNYPDGTLPVDFAISKDTGSLEMNCDMIQPTLDKAKDGHLILTYDENDPKTTG